MTCFMFPGQPLAAAPHIPDDQHFQQIADLTLARTGLDLHSLAWHGAAASESVALQVYGAAMSLYQNRLHSQNGRRPKVIAEHSMGIYAALAGGGAVDEGDALELTCRIGRCMAAMADRGGYALGCMVGLPLEPLLAIAENNGVYLANHNTSRHFLLSGTLAGIEAAVVEALNHGAFSAKVFPSAAPLHTPIMEVVTGSLREIIADYSFSPPVIPVMNHIDQDFLTAGEIADFLLHELLLPVYWEKTYLALRSAGAMKFVEVGFGDALKKYNRWIDSETART